MPHISFYNNCALIDLPPPFQFFFWRVREAWAHGKAGAGRRPPSELLPASLSPSLRARPGRGWAAVATTLQGAL